MKKIKFLSITAILSTLILFVGCSNQATKTETENTPKKETVKNEEPVKEVKGEKVFSGSFEGKNKHETLGTATIIKTEKGFVLELGEDFSFDDAPDPKWAFGKDGFKKETIFAKLKSKKGKQTYEIPSSINPNDFNEVHLWCEKFDVALGVAKLK